jgi:Kef-type K+ transport system membrane component KefB/nucleotide-binding universal stress UspA family protein
MICSSLRRLAVPAAVPRAKAAHGYDLTKSLIWLVLQTARGTAPKRSCAPWALGGFVAAAVVPLVPAWAAGGGRAPSEALLIGQILVLVLLGRLLAEGMLRIGQPAAMGQLLAGILLGPSVLGALSPGVEQLLFPPSAEQKAMIEGIAQFGILLLLLLAGMETDLALLRGVQHATISASISGIALPFASGFLLGQFLPESLLPNDANRLIVSLFIATALSISSVKIVATLVREMGFVRRNIGQVILASAVVDDTIGWIIIAVTLGLASQGFSWLSVGQSVLGTVLFLAASFTFGRRLVFKLIQLTNDHFRSEAPVIAAILVVMSVFALITQLIGVHTVLGGFVAGILIGQSPILTEDIDRQLRGLVAGLFMPVFFGLAGLNSDLTILRNGELMMLTALIVVVASFGKAAGAFIGGYFGGLTRDESLALAMGMNARGSSEVIVATIGLSMGVLSQTLFTMIVAMALITTTAMPPTLRWALRRLPMRQEERQRLEREEYEQRAFVPSLERMLAAIDASATGRFAARLAGLLAGARGAPVTVLSVASERASTGDSRGPAQEARQEARDAQEIVRTAARAAAPKEPVDVIAREHDTPADRAIAEEARRGYGLLMVGVDPVAAPGGSFHENVSRLVREFDGSLAVAIARGAHAGDPLDAPLKILTPVSGNEQSRRGAELAMTLARAAGAEVTALLVISRGIKGQRRRELHAISEEIRRTAQHIGTRVTTLVRTDIAAEDAILETVQRGSYDLLVMGVSRRPGQTLAFGDVAATLLERAPSSLLFVAPQGAVTKSS